MALVGHQLLAEESEEQAHANVRQRRVIARSFITKKRMSGVKLVPFEFHPAFRLVAWRSLARPSSGTCGSCRPHTKRKGALTSRKSLQGVIVFTSAKRAGVNIGRIKGSHCAHLRMKARPDGKMSPQTDAIASDATGAALMGTQKL